MKIQKCFQTMALIMGFSALLTAGGSSDGREPTIGRRRPFVEIVGNTFVPALKGAIGCCDDPWTGGWDEGLLDNWSLTTFPRLDAMSAHGINFTHFRFGPYSDVGLDYLAQGEPFVIRARQRRIIVEIDVYDNWALANGVNLFGHTCAITHAAPTPQVLNQYVYPLVDRYGKYPNVIFNLGNEGFRCNPSQEWEVGLYQAIKNRLRDNGYGDRYVGSQWSHPGEGRPEFDYKTYGSVFRVLAPESIPVILTEDDGGRHHPEEWRLLNANAPEGVYNAVWRGLMSWAEEADTWKYPLPIPNLADCSTPPSGDELCDLRGDNPNLPSAYLGPMSEAVQAQVAAHTELFDLDGRLKGEVEKQQFLLYVTQAMRHNGYCAGIYYADEIAILAPQDKSFGENYDITTSDGMPRWGVNSHAATCYPGIIQGGWSDGDNGPFTSAPPGGGTNLVPNPSFENGNAGDAFNWTEAVNHKRASDNAAEGSWSLRSTFSGPGGVASLTAPISVTANTNYTFSARIYRTGSVGNAYVDMDDIAGEVQLISTGQVGVWQQLSETWHSGPGVSTVTLRCVTDGGINGTVWFDSISLVRSQ